MKLHTGTLDTPPRDAATVVMLRDSQDGLQVLLVRRHAQTAVLGGACVFPGGKLDAHDSSDAVLNRLDRTPGELHARLAEPALAPRAAAAFFAAAAREAFEEVGVLYMQAGRRESSGMDAAAASLRAGEPFGHLLARLGLTLDSDALAPWSRWITPRQPSVINKRFDTRFFLAAAPAGQEAVQDDHEVTELLWRTPRAALEAYRDHAIDLAPPQIVSLAHLARFASVQAALADARSRAPALIAPEPFDDHGVRVLAYPGDERHSVRQRALPCPTRLRYQNERFLPEQGFEAFFDF
ncbi:MAG: NUDIX domain-containing protein [Burkholderiaceae bacterium]|jgi:8-oxo-dGTP pyrophosphatase MutT (NUDIX family)|nr:NUDIX domain-containing protein [Burkholderiaceae bacterium]